MKTQPAFIWAEGAIHLHAKPAVHLDLSFVVDPRDAKLNHSLRFDQALQNSGVPELLAAVDDWPDRLQHLRHRLKKLRFVRVTFSDDFENFLNQGHGIFVYLLLAPWVVNYVRDRGSNLCLVAAAAAPGVRSR